jgi:N-acetylmuramoyl-L-alanine amidase
MRKIVLALLIVGLPILAFIMFSPPGEIPIELVVNGEIIETDTPVITETIDEEEVIYIPAALVCRQLGYETRVDNDGSALTAHLGDFMVRLTVDSSIVSIGGTSYTWDVPVTVIEEVIYMPAYLSAEALGVLIEWDEAAGKLYIDTPTVFDPVVGETEGAEGEETEAPLLNVAYPPEAGVFYYYGESLFVFGTTSSFSQVDVTVNGEPVELLDPRSGNFLTMVDIPRGEETLITVEAANAGGSTTVERLVLYPTWWEKMSLEPLEIHPTRMVPSGRQVLKEGDTLQVAFQGSPGGEAMFRIGDGDTWHSMTERLYPGGPSGDGGIYTAVYRASGLDLPDSGMTEALPVTVSLRKGDRQVTRNLSGSVVFLADFPYKILEVRAEHELKNRGWLYTFNPDQLQLLAATLGGSGCPTSVVSYLAEGTRYRAVGAFGDYYRVEIGSNENYLIHRDVVRELSVSELSEPVLTEIELEEREDKVILHLKTSERFPFFVDDGLSSLALRMHGIAADNEVALPALNGSVKSLSLVPGSGGRQAPAIFTVETDFEMIGFKTSWDGSDLLVEIFKPEKVDRENPLQGKVIIVDPGHGGKDTGAPGPGDLNEKDVNLAMSLYLREMLTEAGAEVIMTRDEDIDVNLYDRPERIDDYDADLFISVHCNAHAASAPATKIHGLMILFNYAHNEKLADIMLQTMAEESELPGFRTWRRNIAVIRHPHVPSVLVEAGYMMHPYDNWYILHPRGQKQLARAMMEGIKNYFLAVGQ